MFPLLAYWVHHLSPFLVRFTDNFGIRYYGLAYLLGFLAALGLLHAYHRAGRPALAPEKIGDLMIAVALGVLIGGRLGYFFLYEPGLLLHHPFALIRVWEGGMASHGGMLGVAVALAWFARKNDIISTPRHVLPKPTGGGTPVSEKVPARETVGLRFLRLGDLMVSVAPAGLLFGRITNFINGELWGKVSGVPWAVIFPLSAPPGTPVRLILPRHPSQLYEAALEGALLLAWMQWRFWKSDVVRTRPGRLSGEFFLGYAVLRMIGETFREPDASLLLGLSRGTFYSLFLAIAGAALILRARRPRP